MAKSIDTLDQLFVNSPFKRLMLKYFEFRIKFLFLLLKNSSLFKGSFSG